MVNDAGARVSTLVMAIVIEERSPRKSLTIYRALQPFTPRNAQMSWRWGHQTVLAEREALRSARGELADYQRNYRDMQEELTWGILRDIAHFVVPQMF